MTISEKKFMEELKKEERLPSEVRTKLEATYDSIRKEKQVPLKNYIKKRGYLIAVAVFLISICLYAYSPLGTATANFLRFGKFTSETLNHEGFISSQQLTAYDKKADIQLTELYVDKNELGLHFTVHLPKNSELLNKKWEKYGLNFGIKNGQDQYLIDFRSGLAEEKEALSLFRSINEEQTIDRETNTLEFIYNLHPTKTGSVPSLEETTIQINGITAYKASDPKVYSIFKGKWELPIDTSKINYFDEINFTPKNNHLLPIERAMAYPTNFVIRFKDEQDFLKKLPKPKSNADNNIQLKIVTEKTTTYYPYSKFTSVTEGSNNYWDMTFDYSGYNQQASIYLELKGIGEIELEK